MERAIIWPGLPHRAVTLVAILSLTLAVLLLAIQSHLASGGGEQTSPGTLDEPDSATRAQISETYGELPMSFEANRGQTNSRVDFISRGSGYALFLTPTEAVLSLGDPGAAESGGERASKEAVLRMQVLGADAGAEASGVGELPGKSNYITGDDASEWRAGVPNFTGVRYEEVYPGVSMFYYGNQRQLEYDFEVAPGADPNDSALGFEGADDLEIAANGDLVIGTAGGEIRQHEPFAYQEVNGEKKEIPSRYVIGESNKVGIEVGAYDETKPLIIDPVLV